MVAALFFVPGAFMLFHRGPMVTFQQSFQYMPSGPLAVSERGAHIFGLLAICVSVSLILFYFYLRRQIGVATRRESRAGDDATIRI